ncbi:MAG: hypothetical protein RMM58_03990 [Chloroflexota bacterium]|nr:hypothetical protein [Dehalococcoidia bacterium]MDW8253022.1 hypothetical protein [Chloroflexota bacterium]
MSVEERLAQGDLVGYAREAGAAAVPTLAALLDDPGRRLAAIEALGATGAREAADRLLPLADDAEKAVRKAARAALHRLKSAGIAPTPASSPPQPAGSLLLGGAMSSFDSSWSHLVRLYVRGTLGARRELSVVINARTGIQAVGWRELAKPVETRLAELVTSGDPAVSGRWTTIPPEYATHLLREAMKRNTATGHGIPPAFLEAERYLTFDDPYREPLIYRHVRPIEVTLDPTLLAHSEAILEEPELAPIGLPEEGSEPYLAEARRIARSPMVVAGVSRERQLVALAQRAHRALLTPPVRQALRSLLEETAVIFWQTDRLLAAKRAVAAALALTTSDSSETPFSARLVTRALLLAASDRSAGGSAPRASSLLWTP